jgi:hypothetical protein
VRAYLDPSLRKFDLQLCREEFRPLGTLPVAAGEHQQLVMMPKSPSQAGYRPSSASQSRRSRLWVVSIAVAERKLAASRSSNAGRLPQKTERFPIEKRTHINALCALMLAFAHIC